MSSVSPVVLRGAGAAAWVQNSLKNGDGLSALALREVHLASGVHTSLLPPTQDLENLNFNEGGMASVQSANDGLADMLERIAQVTALGLVVENDLARRLDPSLSKLSLPVAYLDDRVLHWRLLSYDDPAACVDLIRRGATGYPTNGFFVEAQAMHGLSNHGEVDESWCRRAVHSVVSIVTTAFDAESFVLWLRADLASEVRLGSDGP
ncbi:MAG: hypothetical protein ACRDQ2_10100 [Gaiellales bacterium]